MYMHDLSIVFKRAFCSDGSAAFLCICGQANAQVVNLHL